MKKVDIHSQLLKEVLLDAGRHRTVITSKGKPIALILDVEGLDLEQLELGYSDEFWSLISSRRIQKAISRIQLEKMYGFELGRKIERKHE